MTHTPDRNLGGLIRDLYYKTIPSPICSLINGRLRNEVFQAAMHRFLADPTACAKPENSTLTDLIYGWGNEAWSAREKFLSSCISHAISSNAGILISMWAWS